MINNKTRLIIWTIIFILISYLYLITNVSVIDYIVLYFVLLLVLIDNLVENKTDKKEE